MPDSLTMQQIRAALDRDRTIDITTTGAKTGLPRTTEIWFTKVGDQIIICGTPAAEGGGGPRAGRHWLANMIANPEFLFCLKETLQAELTARAYVVRDKDERRRLMSASETQWYRDQVDSVEQLVEDSPIVKVEFAGEFEEINR